MDGKLALKYVGKDVEAMKVIAKASSDRSLADFQTVGSFPFFPFVLVFPSIRQPKYKCVLAHVTGVNHVQEGIAGRPYHPFSSGRSV